MSVLRDFRAYLIFYVILTAFLAKSLSSFPLQFCCMRVGIMGCLNL